MQRSRHAILAVRHLRFSVKMSSIKPLDSILTWPEYFKQIMHSTIPPIPLMADDEPETGSKINKELNEKVSLFQGDITKLGIDVIVNAANKTLLGGGGVDGAIHSAAGRELVVECAALNGCDTGCAKITKGYNLPAKYVIHTVGPQTEDPDLLQKCYESCLDLAVEKKLRTIAFPCISTGVYGYPQEEAATVALSTIRGFLQHDHNLIDRIIFCVFLDKDKEFYEKYLPKFFPLE